MPKPDIGKDFEKNEIHNGKLARSIKRLSVSNCIWKCDFNANSEDKSW